MQFNAIRMTWENKMIPLLDIPPDSLYNQIYE